MQIDINQKKISIGDKYKIFTDGSQTHTASRVLFRFLPEVRLFNNDGDRARMTIRKKLTWVKPKYEITRWNNSVLFFKTISFWKRWYQCNCDGDIYDIYGHRRRKYSIYKNGIQVAWWDKKAVTWFAGDNYTIIANRDANAELLMTFCLIIDNCHSDKMIIIL